MHVDITHDSDSDSDTEQVELWPRYLLIHSKIPNKPVTKFHPFLVGKTLESIIGKPDVKRLRSGDLLVTVSRRKHSDALRRLTKIGDMEVEVTAHRSLNTSKGIIRDEALSMLEDDELIRCLKSQGVTHVKRLKKRIEGELKFTSTLLLTFGIPTLPESIWAGFYRVKIKQYVPLPLRCYNCQRFGHGKDRCRNQLSCFRCGEGGHDGKDCQATPKCINCKGTHMTSSKDCEKWKEELSIQKIRIEKKLSFPEARRLVQTNSSLPSTQSYAAVAAKKTATRSTGCQTDIPASIQQDATITKNPASPSTTNTTVSKSKCATTNTKGKNERPVDRELLKKLKDHRMSGLRGLPKGQNKYEVLANFEDMDDSPSHIPSLVSSRPPSSHSLSLPHPHEDELPPPPDPPPDIPPIISPCPVPKPITSPLALPIPQTPEETKNPCTHQKQNIDYFDYQN